jgi:phosphate-selective porin
MRLILLVLIVTTIPLAPSAVQAQEEPDSTELDATYRNRRIEIERADGNYRMTLQWRFQFRTSAGFDSPPRSASGLEGAEGLSYRVRRARLKVGGHAYRPWLEYYLEHDFPSSRMLDWRVTVGRPEFQVRVGQWKVNYSRERVQSSGEQSFVERSIVNRAFTLDRQVGVMAFGHLFEGSNADLRYYVGSFTGTGAGATQNDDDAPMYLGRLEWQPLGTDPGMSGGDLGLRTRPALTLAGAWATNRSPFTRFSGSGGGQMDGFTEAGAGQYRLNQLMFETAFKYRGFSFQHETHVKRVEDLTSAVETEYDGTYVQAAFFPSEIFDAPRPLEIGARWAKVAGGPETFDRDMREVTGVVNWYFADHKNKLTFDVSRVNIEGDGGEAGKWRSRLQWDISF